MKLSKIAVLSLAVALTCLGFAGRSRAQSPPEAELAFSTGLMHMREGRADLALQAFKRATKADPKNPYFQKGLGQAYAAKREWSQAIATFRKALEIHPYYVDVRNDLGYALVMSGQREAGKAEFLKAFGDPTNPSPEVSAFNLGRALLEERNTEEAIGWFRTSLTRNKGYAAPYLLLGDALVSSGRLEEAVAQLETAVKEVPDNPELRLMLGQVYFKTGKFAEAKVRLTEAAKADPGGPVGRAASEQMKSLPR